MGEKFLVTIWAVYIDPAYNLARIKSVRCPKERTNRSRLACQAKRATKKMPRPHLNGRHLI